MGSKSLRITVFWLAESNYPYLNTLRDTQRDTRCDTRRDTRRDTRYDTRRDARRDTRHDARHDGCNLGTLSNFICPIPTDWHITVHSQLENELMIILNA